MVCSMTAFARQMVDGDWGSAVWEMRTVNHRYLEISLRLPEELRALDGAVRERISARLKRGKVDCILRLDTQASASAEFAVNAEVVEALAAAAGRINPDYQLNPIEVLRWPGVLETPAADIDTIGAATLGLLDATLDDLVATRRREGQRMGEVIASRSAAAAEQVAGLRTRVPEIVAALKERFAQRVRELGETIDEGRLEQECALLAQKLDVDEEIERLGAHIDEVGRVLKQKGSIGRRLDFLMQELNREANTIGSKSASTETTNISVELKVLIEQMREQVQNIE
ncbi:MAG: YicC family protein [Gammaproteobacteria bacterium]|nr:YicC family protein [Gammaproteobacteria bacterium]